MDFEAGMENGKRKTENVEKLSGNYSFWKATESKLCALRKG
jgi:hypothetical protein